MIHQNHTRNTNTYRWGYQAPLTRTRQEQIEQGTDDHFGQ